MEEITTRLPTFHSSLTAFKLKTRLISFSVVQMDGQTLHEIIYHAKHMCRTVKMITASSLFIEKSVNFLLIKI